MNQKELMQQIGRRLRSFRVSQGLTQKELAAVLGVSHSNISRFERGTVRRLSLVFLNNCRAEFGLSIDWLLTAQEQMIAAEGMVSLPKRLPRKKSSRKRSSRFSTLAEQRSLQQKLNELTASLARATRLVHELFAHARDRDARAKRK